MLIAPAVLARLRERAVHIDQSGDWPAEQFQWLAEAGILGWSIPRAYSGAQVSQAVLIRGYEDLAAACLTTAFILTQRTGACQRLAACSNEELKSQLLPKLVMGEIFVTVGISHLTTSRQHLKSPAVSVSLLGDRITINGSIPWVTGAAQAQYIVTGGTCADGRQVLLALPTDAPGVAVQPHASLLALTASHTASVNVSNVVLPGRCLLAGPVHEVMKQGLGGGTGSQTTSTLALGVSSRVIDFLQAQAAIRPELHTVADLFQKELEQLRRDIYASVVEPNSDHEALATLPPSAAEIRQRANSLVLRSTQAALAVSKGAGYVRGHLAELSVREAMFFLVWSCPQPVLQGMLEQFSRGLGNTDRNMR